MPSSDDRRGTTATATPAIRLRPLAPADAAQTRVWHSDEALYRTLVGAYHGVIDEATEAAWVAARATAPDELNLVVCQAEDGRPLGLAYLRAIDRSAGTAELHLLIGDPAERGRGIGSAATRLLLERGFGELGLQRITLQVLASNEAAIRTYRRCGFVEQGRRREPVVKDGRPVDVLVMDCLAGAHR